MSFSVFAVGGSGGTGGGGADIFNPDAQQFSGPNGTLTFPVFNKESGTFEIPKVRVQESKPSTVGPEKKLVLIEPLYKTSNAIRWSTLTLLDPELAISVDQYVQQHDVVSGEPFLLDGLILNLIAIDNGEDLLINFISREISSTSAEFKDTLFLLNVGNEAAAKE